MKMRYHLKVYLNCMQRYDNIKNAPVCLRPSKCIKKPKLKSQYLSYLLTFFHQIKNILIH